MQRSKLKLSQLLTIFGEQINQKLRTLIQHCSISGKCSKTNLQLIQSRGNSLSVGPRQAIGHVLHHRPALHLARETTARSCRSGRSRRELSNAYLLAKFGFGTAENEPCQVCPLSLYNPDHFYYYYRYHRSLAYVRVPFVRELLETVRDTESYYSDEFERRVLAVSPSTELTLFQSFPESVERVILSHGREVFGHKTDLRSAAPDPTNFRGLVLGCIEAKFCK